MGPCGSAVAPPAGPTGVSRTSRPERAAISPRSDSDATMPGMSAITALDETTWAEATWPLGTHLRADGTTFAVYAPAATRVQLEIYPESPCCIRCALPLCWS